MRTTLRRVAAVAAPALVLSGLSLVATPTAVAAPPYDPSPVAAGASWLTSQLNSASLLSIRSGGVDFDDYGLSIDGGFAELSAGNTAVATQIRDAVAVHINDYITGEAFGDAGSTYAGPTAKALVYAQASGGTPTSFGGVNLVTRLESVTGASGRIADVSTFGDFANTIGQSFAARGLTTAASAESAAATTFLLNQQCPAGFFRLAIGDAQCADNNSPDTDVTALAVLNLRSQVGSPVVDTALAKAVAWLQATQKADGSFGGGGPTAAPNANSTGLAGWALGESGASADAEQAAIWLRQHQLAKAGGCANSAAADKGAVSYDDTARTAAATTPLTVATRDQYVRATAQAIPALRWAPLGASMVAVVKPAKGEFKRAGSKVTVATTSANPGDLVCVSLRSDAPVATLIADASGGASTAVTLPAGDGTSTYNVTDSGGAVATYSFEVLDKTKFKVKAAKVVHRGDRVVVRISGLARDEKFKVLLDGTRVAKGKGTGKGSVTVQLRSGGLGGHRVKVVGQYADRKGKTSYRVVR
jgi:hypothetical protein